MRDPDLERRVATPGSPGQSPSQHWQVIVAGGGTAGSVAAVAAARNGAHTLVIEEQGFLGGTATGALVTPMMPNRLGETNLNRGITDEIKQRLREAGAGGETPENDGWFDPEALKFVLEEMVVEAGVATLYHTSVIGTTKSKDASRLSGIVIHNAGGTSALTADVVVDATGDADVAAMAGCEWESGSPSGERQALSLRWIAGGIDIPRMQRFVQEFGGQTWPAGYFEAAMIWGRGDPLEPVFRKAVEAGDLKEQDGDYFQCFSVPGRPDALAFNCPRIATRVNGLDPWDLSHAQIEGRQAIKRLLAFLRRYIPGATRAYVQHVAPMVGIRESRRIIGEYTLTLEDVLQARSFPDAIARNRYPVDVHRVMTSSQGRSADRETRPSPSDSTLAFGDRPPSGKFHEIPYRCLVPRSVDGILVAGRSLSATFEAQSAVRIQPNCHSFGQAAGTAAALAARRGVGPREVDGKELRAILRQQGANV